MSDPHDKPIADRPMLRLGDHGVDVEDMQALLPGFTGEIDGDFGPVTDQAVRNFQRAQGLVVDGICGPQTWTALYAAPPGPTPSPPPVLPPLAFTVAQQQRIMDIANGSIIARYSWSHRGLAPRGFNQGMAVAFGQTYRKLKARHPAALKMARARMNSSLDALNIYRAAFTELGMSNETAGPDVLRHLYALMMGHGMRESSGKYCEGRDISADNVSSDTAEAGLFQTSYNAHSHSDPEFSALMAEYSAVANKPTCYLDAFNDDVSCSMSSWSNYGSGAGLQFQRLCKNCPAFACETAALTLRFLASHYGPIMRREAELKSAANAMFQAVQDYVDTLDRVS